MIDRVADALRMQHYALAGRACVPWRVVNDDERQVWRLCATGAIRAMREPTEEMVDAYRYDMYEPDPREQWRDMIDAALKDGVAVS